MNYPTKSTTVLYLEFSWTSPQIRFPSCD